MEAEAQREPRLLAGLVAVARSLRADGVPVGTSDLLLGLRAAAAVGVERDSDLKVALRACWCRRRSDLELFERAFARQFSPAPGGPQQHSRPALRAAVAQASPAPEAGPFADGAARPTGRGVAGMDERLRRLDFSACTREELADLERAVAALAARPALRRSRRPRPARHGRELDWRRTTRSSLRHGGELLELRRRRRGTRPRRLLLICDVSGSMERYARLLVRFLHAVERSSPGCEAFLFGTRLTRVTRELRHRDPGSALSAVGAAVDDWAGGTRIGDCLTELVTRWSGRALGRSPVTILVSDGWDTGDPARLAAATARLQRSSRILIWCNPRMGDPEFRPAAAGMRAALPHVDRLQPVHNFASLTQLSRLLSLERPARPRRPQRAPERLHA